MGEKRSSSSVNLKERLVRIGEVDQSIAYSIRDSEGNRVVSYAAILYPGPSISFSEGLEGLQCYPGLEVDVQEQLESVFYKLL